MKYFRFFSLLTLFVMLTSACQADDAALARVQSAINSYQAGNGNQFDGQLTMSLRQSSSGGCPGGLQYGCLQLAYKNFAIEQHATIQSPRSFTFFPYDRQTTPNIKMVLVEGNWGGSPSVVISCQVFFVLTDGSLSLIDNFDIPQAMTCKQRGEELTRNLFGSSDVQKP